MDTQRLLLFIVFSFAIFLLWDAWQREQLQPAPPKAPVTAQSSEAPRPSAGLTTGAAPSPGGEQPGILTRGERIKVVTDTVQAEIDTVGGDLRRLELLKQRESADRKKNFVLLEDTPQRPYVAQTGLIDGDLPTHKAVFTAAAREYKLGQNANSVQAALTWTDGKGVRVDKIYTFHRGSYRIDVTYRITNGSTVRLEPHAYYQLVRHDHPPADESRFISTYTGPAFYTDKDKFHKTSFSDITKGKATYPKQSQDGWVAMLQHYFLTAWLPKAGVPREFYAKDQGAGVYAAGIILPVGTINPGTTREVTVPLYAGPQEQERLSELAPGLDLTVDYGMLTVIAAPLFWLLSWIYKGVQNWGVAIILLTVLIKIAFYPLSAKSYRSMAHMRVLTPKLQKLKEQYGDDRQRLHQAMMELYKTEKINPLGGCLPVLVQIPVFIALYWVLLYSVEMRQAPFALWIHDLSAPDPFYVLPIIMGLTMIVQTRLNPTPPDPIQAKVMMIMPIAFSIFFFFFPAGLVLYWVVNNILSIAQQWMITRAEIAPKAAKGHGKS